MSEWQNVMNVGEPVDDVEECPTCGCSFLEVVEVREYQKFHFVINGQKPPTKNLRSYYLFKCPCCNTAFSPPIQQAPGGVIYKDYNRLMDALDRGEMVKLGNEGVESV